MDRISNTTLTALLDLKKHLVHVKGDLICWKMYNLEIQASDMFKSLSDRNKNRVLYYGASIIDNALKGYRIEAITELLDMDNYFDTTTKENVCVIFAKFFRDLYPPGAIFADNITVFSAEDISKNWASFMNDELTEATALKASFNYAALLLCNFEWNEGVIDFFCPLINKLPHLDTMNKVLNHIFYIAKLPEPTINYLSNGEARVIK